MNTIFKTENYITLQLFFYHQYIGMKSSYGSGYMYGTQMQFNPKKRLTLYDQNGKRWKDFGSRQSKRQQSHNNNHYRIGTTDSYPYYGIKQKFIKVNRKARQLPQLCKFFLRYFFS